MCGSDGIKTCLTELFQKWYLVRSGWSVREKPVKTGGPGPDFCRGSLAALALSSGVESDPQKVGIVLAVSMVY